MTQGKKLKIVYLIIAILMIIIVSGCNKDYPKETVVMATHIYHAVPKSQGDKQIFQCEFIDADQYGRTLFAFHTAYTNGVCILQKYDDKSVYYYDNVSFLIGLDKYKECTQEELDLLKEANDWNKTLDDNLMIKRDLIKSTLNRKRESVINQKIAVSAYNKTYEASENIWSTVVFFDYDQSGQELFYIQKAINTSTTGDFDWELTDEYLMILKADGTYDPDNYLMRIDDWGQINTLLTEIKENNGWVG